MGEIHPNKQAPNGVLVIFLSPGDNGIFFLMVRQTPPFKRMQTLFDSPGKCPYHLIRTFLNEDRLSRIRASLLKSTQRGQIFGVIGEVSSDPYRRTGCLPARPLFKELSQSVCLYRVFCSTYIIVGGRFVKSDIS